MCCEETKPKKEPASFSSDAMFIIDNGKELEWCCPIKCGGKMLVYAFNNSVVPIEYYHICDNCKFERASHVAFPINYLIEKLAKEVTRNW